jgi:hypothetical protein
MSATCIRNVENITNYDYEYRMDHNTFNKDKLKKMLPVISPKITELIKKIDELDKSDMAKDQKLYKHMIFSDLKAEGGAKTVGGSLLANGFNLIYDKKLTIPEEIKKSSKNFAILCSTKIYKKEVTVGFRRKILDIYNDRPSNIHGENLRFMVLDYGFKEGIDLFDVKYIHILETPVTRGDEKQIIGRGTRFCGQKGLKFHQTDGWLLHVYKYRTIIPPKLKEIYKTDTLFELFMKYSKIDGDKEVITRNLENICIQSSIDFNLNKNIHLLNAEFKEMVKTASPIVTEPLFEKGVDKEINCALGCKRNISVPTELLLMVWYMMPSLQLIMEKWPRGTLCKNLMKNKDYCKRVNIVLRNYKEYIYTNRRMIADRMKSIKSSNKLIQGQLRNIYNFLKDTLTEVKEPNAIPQPPKEEMPYSQMQRFMRRYYKEYEWPEMKIENLCTEPVQENNKISFTPTQLALQHYFQPSNPYKGLLLWHSTGVGKTCTAISVATNSFEKEGYTILWVTRHTLKSEIWKNMFKQICSITLQDKQINIKEALRNPLKYLSKNWMLPITYKQFSNLLERKNQFYKEMVKRNGEADPLKKTIIIIDEAHKLVSGDLKPQERPNFNTLKKFILDSYELSKENSVRVLLMSATPYTANPMDMIKLLNLLRPKNVQLEEDLDKFKNTYLDSGNNFKDTDAFLDELSGYISYLNREGDIRQFARPVLHTVNVPMSLSNKDVAVQELEKLDVEYEELDVQKDKLVIQKKDIRTKGIAKQNQVFDACEDIKNKVEKANCKKELAKKLREQTRMELKKVKDEDLKYEQKMNQIKKRMAKINQDLKNYKELDPSQERVLAEKCFKQEAK